MTHTEQSGASEFTKHGNDPALRSYISEELHVEVPAGEGALARELCKKYGDAVLAILFYGSCLRNTGTDDGIVDLYVVVDRYRHAYANLGPAIANALLPPNVYYCEIDLKGRTVRSKYAVISLADFAHMTSASCFSSILWARFAQPTALVYARDQASEDAVINSLLNALRTFIIRVIPGLSARFDATTLWQTGLRNSYACELRPESQATICELIERAADRYQFLTETIVRALPFEHRVDFDGGRVCYTVATSDYRRWLNRQSWRVRRIQGKFLNLLRLMKAAFTFDGGVDYLLWKIERHSGIHVEATPLMRKYPLLACWGTLWRLYRLGAFR